MNNDDSIWCGFIYNIFMHTYLLTFLHSFGDEILGIGRDLAGLSDLLAPTQTKEIRRSYSFLSN